MQKTLTLALVQRCSCYDIDKNVAKALLDIETASDKGADFIVFPECFITDYYFPKILEDLPPLSQVIARAEYQNFLMRALTDSSPYLKALCNKALECRINVVIGAMWRNSKNELFNKAFLIDRQGQIKISYSKVHTCDFSVERYLKSGDKFYVASVDGINVGLMICYDREYPESARILHNKGAELVFILNNCSDMPPRLKEISVQAMQNMSIVAMANVPGINKGRSCVYHPMVFASEKYDNTAFVADETFDGIAYVHLDLDKIKDYVKKEDLGKYRKTGAYTGLI